MKNILLPVMLVVAIVAGCGGGDGAAPVAAEAPAGSAPPEVVDTPVPVPVAIPAIPTGLAAASGAKRLDSTWNAAAGAITYRLLEDLDGAGPDAAVQVGATVAANASSYVPQGLLHTRLNAQYRVQACNAAGCSAASPPVTPSLDAAIGYFKASSTDANDNFGWSVALSADGSTLAVGATGEDSNATGVNGDPSDNAGNNVGAVYVFVRGNGGGWTQQAYLKPTTATPGASFGRDVALSADGAVLAVGAVGESTAAGAVYVFARDASAAWALQARVTAGSPDPHSRFGESVGLSADGAVLAVGALYEDSGATGVGGDETDNSAADSGAVFVFRRAAGTWTQEAYVKASDASDYALFGAAVALSPDGGTLAVGARGVNGEMGAAYVFTRAGGSWAEQALLTASNAAVGDRFGAALALSADGNTLAVSASWEDGATTGVNGNQADNGAAAAGAAYVFTRAGTTWSQQAYLKASNTGAGDWFGHALALSANGNVLAVGAPWEDSTGSGLAANPADNGAVSTGATYVFTRAGSLWSHPAYLKAPNPGPDGYFGSRVALSADGASLAVGGLGDRSSASGVQGNQADAGLTWAGAVYLY